MNEHDERIRKELQDSDAEWLKSLREEPSLLSLVSSTFQGRNRWHTVLSFIELLIIAGVSVWCAIRFFGATTLEAKLAWSTGFLTTLLMIVLLKMWLGMTIVKNHILREVKRIELQVARLERPQTK